MTSPTPSSPVPHAAAPDDFAASRAVGRRQALTIFGSVGATLLTARLASASTPPSTATTCDVTPTETGGPFPADGTSMGGPGGGRTPTGSVASGSLNGAAFDVLDEPAFVRSDMRSNLDGTDTQAGVPLTLTVRVTSSTDNCAPLVGAAVYVWHCSPSGHYSGYSSNMNGGDYSGASWCRAIQLTDDTGAAAFQTVLPGRYDGRAFHLHYQVFSDATYATHLLTSQMAAADEQVDALYAAAGEIYATALANVTTNAADNIFSDGVEQQLLDITGDVSTGLTAVLHATV